MRRLAVVLLVSAAGLGAAQAAPVAPWAPDPCDALTAKFSEATRIGVTASTGDPRSVIDLAPAGKACLFSGKATGLTQTFAEALERLEAVLAGWAQIPELAADGPDATVQGYRKGDRRVIVQLERTPPKGTCENGVQAACKVPAKRWQWTFRAAAYRE